MENKVQSQCVVKQESLIEPVQSLLCPANVVQRTLLTEERRV